MKYYFWDFQRNIFETYNEILFRLSTKYKLRDWGADRSKTWDKGGCEITNKIQSWEMLSESRLALQYQITKTRELWHVLLLFEVPPILCWLNSLSSGDMLSAEELVFLKLRQPYSPKAKLKLSMILNSSNQFVVCRCGLVQQRVVVVH